MRALHPIDRFAVLLALVVWLHPAATRAAGPPNLVFILSDDHRFDFLGFHDGAPPFLETPHLDRMAREGAHLANAFVTTSLCSPSRASILTGRYMHGHRVADNQRPVPPGTVFFPEYLRRAGYETALVGKWHMGHDDDAPRPGFDHWVSFRGQGDNGFALGEHGFYDKRDAFEESIRVPLLAWAPGRIAAGTRIDAMVQNIDIAPTLLALAGVEAPAEARFDGASFAPLLAGESVPWRDEVLYEYYWEWNFPATPTTFALRTERFKYIWYHGVWDTDGFYDLATDPHERHNLIEVPAYREQVTAMRERLFDRLEASGGLTMPIRRPAGERLDARKLRR